MIAQNNFGVLKLIMTPQDLKQIGGLIDKKLDEQTKKLNAKFDEQDKKFDVKLGGLEVRIGMEFDEKLGNLEQKMFEWRSEVINSVDALAKEIRDEREFREITTSQIVENRERTDRLEKKVFGAVVG